MSLRIAVLGGLTALALCLAAPYRCSATLVDDRLTSCLSHYIRHSTYPNPNQMGEDWRSVMLRCEGRLGKAMATMKQWPARSAVERTSATTYIDWVCNEPTNNPVSHYGRDEDFPCHFSTPMMVRLLLDPDLSQRLTVSNILRLKRVLWQFVEYRSELSSATASVWYSYASENHNMLDRSSFLLALMALSPQGDGFDGNLHDGHSIATHLAAWKKWFFEYFRQRAREGLNWEVASKYNPMTLACWLNIADLMDTSIPLYGAYGDDHLRAMARQAIDLFWATNGSEYMPLTGLRCGPGGTRLYEANINEGAGDFRRLLYAYNWHDDFDYSFTGERRAWFHITNMIPFVSSYRIPAPIENYAHNIDRAPFLYTGRRPGKGPNGNEATAVFGSDHSSDIRRDVWWHPAYVIGGITVRTDLAYGAPDAYVHGIDSDRAMGVFFSSDKDDRIMFYGIPDAFEGGTAAAVNAVCGKRFLMGGWDRNARHNAGIRFFFSDGPIQDSLISENGWIFTTAPAREPHGAVFVGIKICEGGFTTSTKNDHGWPVASCGILLDFKEKRSPFLMEVASASDGYSNLAAFMVDCMDNPYSYNADTKKMTYTSCAGDNYEYTGNSAQLPKVGLGGVVPTTISLNPAKTYDSPYVQGWHGSDIVAYSDGQSTATLDFNYTMSPQWDDYQTAALWHMESIAGGKVVDDDLDYTGRNRNNDLSIFGGAIAIGGGPSSLLGNSLEFDGIDDMATVAYNAAGPKGWAGYPEARIDFWFKPDSLPEEGMDRDLISAAEVWSFRQYNGSAHILLYVWNANGGIDTAEVRDGGGIGTWHKVTGIIRPDKISLTVDGVTQSTATHSPMKQANAPIYLGNRAGKARWFDGRIDEVKIRKSLAPSDPPPATAKPTATPTPIPAPTPTPLPGSSVQTWLAY